MRVRLLAPATALASAMLVTACGDDSPAGLSNARVAAAAATEGTTPLPSGITADTLAVGATAQLTASEPDVDLVKGVAKGRRKITWATSNAAVLSVTSSGEVKAVGNGVASVSATGLGVADVTWFVVIQPAPAAVEAPAVAPTPTTPAPAPSAPTPAPTPTPVVEPTPTATAPTAAAPTDARAKVFALVGDAPSVATVRSWGGAFAAYEDQWADWSERHWATEGAAWDQANYYDRAKIYYVYWARTGNPVYLDRANQLALNYRINYLAANNYGSSAHWSQLEGVALHYLLTGDETSRMAVGRVADALAVPYYMDHLNDKASTEMESRQQAKVLLAFVVANQIKAPSQAGRDWAVMARDALTKIIASQGSDGAFRWQPGMTVGQCGYNKPFMSGMLNDAMIRYYNLFEKDSRILPTVKKSLDYLWARDVQAYNSLAGAGQSVVYLDGQCGADGPGVTPDLNNLVTSGFGFVYKMTGDATYKARGDALMLGSITTNISGSKNFNQQYTTSYHYLQDRQ